ncbi:MAG: hypothetical protein KF809_05115 [Chloroflexi bacterium]|nr:hypothetical protein [Chloroflexota bacterium]
MTMDKLDWHWDAAVGAGQPGEQGFVHVACVLAWAIQRDLVAERIWPSDLVERVRDGSVTLDELIEASDQRLVDPMLTHEGRRFIAHSYDAFLHAYDEAFPDVPDYAVPFDATTRHVTAGLLDDLYGAWVAAGRPKPEPGEDDDLTPEESEALERAIDQAFDRQIVIPADATDEEIDALLDGIEGPYVTLTLPPGMTEDDLARLHESTHDRPDLEARLPPTLGGIRPYLYSESMGVSPGTRYRLIDPVAEVLTRAGIDARDLGMASGGYQTDAVIIGVTRGHISVDLWDLPDGSRDALLAAIRETLRPEGRRLRWTEETMGTVRAWSAAFPKWPGTRCHALSIDGNVVTVTTDDPSYLAEAVAWFGRDAGLGASDR